MNKKLFFSILLLIILFGCINSTKSGESQSELTDTFVLPEESVPIVYRGHIYIPSEVDTILGNFVFDTGADGLYLDSTFYAINPFEKHKSINAFLPGAGTSGPQKVIVITDTMSFTFKNYSNNLSFIPVLSLKSILGDFADGILGTKYFSNQILEINYFREYLKWHDDISTIDTSEFVKISMKKESNRFFIPARIQINETISIQDYFCLDIGSGGSISITSRTANKYDLFNNISTKIQYDTKYGGIGGQSSSFYFKASSIEIGGYTIEEVVMDFSKDKSGALASSEHAGLLGNVLLERFDIIIDFANNDLYLRPNTNYDKPFVFSRLGFKYIDRSITMNAWIVTGFYKGSNAELSELKIDDKIVSVNGIDIHEISYKEQADFWNNTDKVVIVVLRNGEEKRIEFGLDYVL